VVHRDILPGIGVRSKIFCHYCFYNESKCRICAEAKRRFFEKKRAKKLLLCWVMGVECAIAHDPAEQKSFCFFFFRKRSA
jgi:hypothetical protein